MFDEPIKTVQQAEEYFLLMGCSHFHMGRENLQRYKEYEQLKISKQMEASWRTERLDEYYSQIMTNKVVNPLWAIHSSMDELVEVLKTDSAVEKMLEVTEYIRDIVLFKDRVIVAETINGRKFKRFRSGLIYLAYDINLTKLCNEIMVELCL